MKANRKYKDSMFTKLFSKKENILELYNAVEGTNLSINDTAVDLETLENVLFMDQYNDLAFLLNKKLIVLAEHQSSVNYNICCRMLQYIGRTYEKIVDNKALYREKLVNIPTPEFFVLYNGTKDMPLESTLKLSDSYFEKTKFPKLELEVKVININHEKHNKVLEKSKILEDYSYFVYKVRSYRKPGKDLAESVQLAVNECIEENRLRDFLNEHGSEVANMLYTEFNLEDAKEVWQEEAREDGIKEGVLKTAAMFLDVLDIRTIAEKTGLSIHEVEELKKQKQ